MSEKLKFYKGLEENLANITIELGAIYHCTDTGNTYIGVIDPEGEVLEDGTYPLKLDLYSTVSDIYIGDDDEIEGGFELVNADTLGGFPADEYALKSHVYEKIDEININSYATKEEVNALTYENVGAAPAGDYATKDDLNIIDFPVDSVNGRTGAITLTASDIDAAPMTYAKKVGAPYNLLDNSDFRNPVNQRGKTAYSEVGTSRYTIDRWKATGNVASATLTSSGIEIKAATGNHGFFASHYESKQFFGKRLTFAVKFATGEIKVCSGIYLTANPTSTKVIGENVGTSANIQIVADVNTATFQIRANNGSTVVVEWAALYEGEYTAETLPEYQPKGYAAELLECKRYFNVVNSRYIGLGNGNNRCFPFVPLPIKMRANPTVVVINLGQVSASDGKSRAVTSIVSSGLNEDGIMLRVNVDTATNGKLPSAPVMLQDPNIQLSADL